MTAFNAGLEGLLHPLTVPPTFSLKHTPETTARLEAAPFQSKIEFERLRI
jgi:hypothetical protein